MIRTDRRMRICTTLLVLNLCFIWGNSLLPGEISGAFSNWVKDLIFRFLPGDPGADTGGGLLRKLAHFTEFAALGILLTWRLWMLGRKKRYALPAGFLAACLDETIQMFVPDRGPGLKDVAIDTCGVLTGIWLLHFGYSVWKRKSSETNGGNEK